MGYKKGLITALLHRPYNILSDYANFHHESLFLKSMWQNNSFPLLFIDKCVKRFLDKLLIKKKKEKDSSTKKEIFRTCNKEIKLTLVFKSAVRMPNAFRLKGQIRKCFNSMLLYKFTCNTCNSVYISKTNKLLCYASLSI